MEGEARKKKTRPKEKRQDKKKGDTRVGPLTGIFVGCIAEADSL